MDPLPAFQCVRIRDRCNLVLLSKGEHRNNMVVGRISFLCTSNRTEEIIKIKKIMLPINIALKEMMQSILTSKDQSIFEVSIWTSYSSCLYVFIVYRLDSQGAAFV